MIQEARPAPRLRPDENPLPLCNLYVSMLQRMGIETDKFGSSTQSGVRGLDAAI